VPADRPIDRAAWAELINELIRTETAGRKATFARLVGVDPKTISHWLAGTVDVAEASVRRVADALGRTPADMLIRVGYYRADEFSSTRDEEPAERDEEVEEIMRSNLPIAIKRDLLQVLAEERKRDKERRQENMRRLIQAQRRRTG
jgi:transcriptional regulator with XRE-family HTH domain